MLHQSMCLLRIDSAIDPSVKYHGSITVQSLSTFSANHLPGVYHGSNGAVTRDPFLSDVTVTEDDIPDLNFDNADSSSVADSDEETVWNWRYLQICGIALDVRESLERAFPYHIHQAIRDSQTTCFIRPDRTIAIEEVAGVQNLSELFLNALYKNNGHQHPEYRRASAVYICAIAMTFFFQPNAHDTRLIREFNRDIGEIRLHLSIDPNISAQDCHRMIMGYLIVNAPSYRLTQNGSMATAISSFSQRMRPCGNL